MAFALVRNWARRGVAIYIAASLGIGLAEICRDWPQRSRRRVVFGVCRCSRAVRAYDVHSALYRDTLKVTPASGGAMRIARCGRGIAGTAKRFSVVPGCCCLAQWHCLLVEQEQE